MEIAYSKTYNVPPSYFDINVEEFEERRDKTVKNFLHFLNVLLSMFPLILM